MFVGDGGGIYSICGIACEDEDSPYFVMDWKNVTCKRCEKVLTKAHKKVERNKLKKQPQKESKR